MRRGIKKEKFLLNLILLSIITLMFIFALTPNNYDLISKEFYFSMKGVQSGGLVNASFTLGNDPPTQAWNLSVQIGATTIVNHTTNNNNWNLYTHDFTPGICILMTLPQL